MWTTLGSIVLEFLHQLACIYTISSVTLHRMFSLFLVELRHIFCFVCAFTELKIEYIVILHVTALNGDLQHVPQGRTADDFVHLKVL